MTANPFGHIKGAVKGDPARRCFVPGDIVMKVIDVAPDPQWKLLIGLARWGGLRIPSEALALTWQDVDFENRRFIVRASKTEHHEDGGVRVVPMFPELVPLFQAVFDDAPEGALHVITRYRTCAVNLRTQFQRYIEKAGVKPWPKLWQNLRATRATELADQFPSHVCAAWLGHTERVADAFYRQVTDEHFAAAVRGDEKAAQKAAQQPHAGHRIMSHDPSLIIHNPGKCNALRDNAKSCDCPNKYRMGAVGFEPTKAEPTDLQSVPFDHFGTRPSQRRCSIEDACKTGKLIIVWSLPSSLTRSRWRISLSHGAGCVTALA